MATKANSLQAAVEIHGNRHRAILAVLFEGWQSSDPR